MVEKEIVRMTFGSHLYGTDTKDSDFDYKGVALPTKELLESGEAIPKTFLYTSTGFSHQKNSNQDVDVEIYSLHYFIQLALEGQTVALDMLHANPHNWVGPCSPVWRDIVDNRERFYTKNVETFIRYARKQAAKYGCKGSRISDVRAVITWLTIRLDKFGPKTKLRDLDLETFPTGDAITWLEAPEKGSVHNDQQLIPSVRIVEKEFQLTTRIPYILLPLQKYLDQYGGRALQAENNEGVDWKAVSHAFRAAYQVRELFTEGTITFPLKDAEYLKRMKQGEFSYKDIAPKLDDLVDEVQQLKDTCHLPEKPDYDFWSCYLKHIEDMIKLQLL